MRKFLLTLVFTGFIGACAHNDGGPLPYTELERINDSIKQSQRINNIYDHATAGAPLMY